MSADMRRRALIVALALMLTGALRAHADTTADTARAELRTKQFAAAFATLRTAAERGDRDSEYLLGLAYANGIGVPAATGDARRWLTAAAQQSHPGAMYALAGLLAGGSEADRTAARDWLERAARAGDPTARRLVADHALPLAPARAAAGDPHLARELTRWAVRRNDAQSVVAFVRASGGDAEDEFGRSPLEWAAEAGSADVVRALLAAGARPGHRDHYGVTPLMLAAAGSSAATLEELLRHPAEIDAKDAAGNTALVYAARAGRAEAVRRLIAAGAAVDVADQGGWTALDMALRAEQREVAQILREAHAQGRVMPTRVSEETGVDPSRSGKAYAGWPALAIAASRGDSKVIAQQLSAGVPVDGATPEGDTALLVAVKSHAPSVIEPLLNAGANPLRPDAMGRSALGRAADLGDIPVIDALLAGGVSPDARAASEEPALIQAARAGHADAVRRLIEGKADVNRPGSGGRTALMIAAAANDADLVKLLVAAGANTRDRDQHDALWHAARQGAAAAVDSLLAAGAPVDAPQPERSPLFAAVLSGHGEIVPRLIAKGASGRIRTASGVTPLMVAAARGLPELVRPLIEAGTDVNAQNSAGDTALIIATRAGHTEVCRALLGAGADAALRNKSRIDALDTARRRRLDDLIALLGASH